MINSETIWKRIEGFPDYEISNQGEVRNRYGRILKTRLDNNGYESINLYYEVGKHTLTRIHRLVAIAFIQNPKGLPIVNHINNKRNDNRLVNLEWVNHSENAKHAVRTGSLIRGRGEKSPRAKLKEKDIPIIRDMISRGMTSAEIGRIYNIHAATISAIKTGKSWSWV